MILSVSAAIENTRKYTPINILNTTVNRLIIWQTEEHPMEMPRPIECMEWLN